MYQFFVPIPQCAEDLKSFYKTLCKKHHPDNGGSNEFMKVVNSEYEILFGRLKDIHRNAEGNTYESKEKTSEKAKDFINIIDKIIRFSGVKIEIIGSFIWVTGNTFQYKAALKELKFKWSAKKSAWYLPPENYTRRARRFYDLEEIRGLYGSEEVKTKEAVKIG